MPAMPATPATPPVLLLVLLVLLLVACGTIVGVSLLLLLDARRTRLRARWRAFLADRIAAPSSLVRHGAR